MTRAGATLDDVPAHVSWRALGSFIDHLGTDSALARELDPDAARWLGTEQVQTMLADLIDVVRQIQWQYVCSHKKGGKPQKPKPYPRPWAKDDATRIGREAIPIRDFDNWWDGGDA